MLTWNLFHGRAVPPAGRDLQPEFAAALAGWQWDVALLQEVPPWWPEPLARATGAQERHALTSRNELAALRRALATRRPDVMKSAGGGANAILVRGGQLAEHRVRRLRRWPERRVVHAVALADGTWVANVHCQAHSERRAMADLQGAATALEAWAPGAPAILGGDLNLAAPSPPAGFVHAGGHAVDHVLARGLAVSGVARTLDAGELSDHAPVTMELKPDWVAFTA